MLVLLLLEVVAKVFVARDLTSTGMMQEWAGWYQTPEVSLGRELRPARCHPKLILLVVPLAGWLVSSQSDLYDDW